MATLDSGEQSNLQRVDSDAQKPAALPEALNAGAKAADSLSQLLGTAPKGNQAATDSPSLIGTTIDKRFRILSALGKGGMSEVFKAEHLILQKLVAIKVLHQHQFSKANSIERFQQEAKAISTLDHPNIVRIHAFGISENQKLYLVMDYLDGNSLSELLEAEGHLSCDRVINFAMQIAAGLEHAHSRGIIHRDLKPSNIVLQQDEFGKEQIKIVDFGVARLTNESGKEVKQLTLQGNTCGSPPYMSPEQCLGDAVDARSDIYSFGCMLYELLSGKRPFQANTAIELMQKHLEQSPKFFRSVCPKLEIPSSLEAIVRNCLAKNPDLRYQSMTELLADLKEIGNSSAQEEKLTAALKREELSSQTVTRMNGFRGFLLPVLGLFLLLAGAELTCCQFMPQLQSIQLKREIESIPVDDARRLEKLQVLLPQLIQLDVKTGDKASAFLHVQQLEKEVMKAPSSFARCKAQVKIIEYYIKLGKAPECTELVNRTIATLSAGIQELANRSRVKEMEPLLKENIRLCRMTEQEPALVLGQYNLLVSAYLILREYHNAEIVARQELQFTERLANLSELEQISALSNLANALEYQNKFAESEPIRIKTLQSARAIANQNPAYLKAIAAGLIACYEHQGKSQDAARLRKEMGL